VNIVPIDQSHEDSSPTYQPEVPAEPHKADDPTGTITKRPTSDRPDELVFAFVYPVGAKSEAVQAALEDQLKQFGYSTERLRLSDYLGFYVKRLKLKMELPDAPEDLRIESKMDAGNKVREVTKREDFLTLAAVAEMNARRSKEEGRRTPKDRSAYILLSLKRPEEAMLLRDIYGPAFYLIGVYATEQERLAYLQNHRGIGEEKARHLIQKDQNEANPYGQRTRDTFSLADIFIRQDSVDQIAEISRFVDLIFGYPYHTPTRDEQHMFFAYAASLRSGDLSRQVGAAIANRHGDLVATGCNDVPSYGGGLYWPGVRDRRDWQLGFDSNERRKSEILQEILPCLTNARSVGEARIQLETAEGLNLTDEALTRLLQLLNTPLSVQELKERLRGTDEVALSDENLAEVLSRLQNGLTFAEAKTRLEPGSFFDLTEFGRTVHAEMDALLTCARLGASSIDATLFTTTFPCHNCTRHIVAAGVKRVVYIEPYPKSLALRLHYDAIDLEERGWARSTVTGCFEKVSFQPFVGVGPRRFFDLFSMKLSTGSPIKRKAEGELVVWRRAKARCRVPLLPTSYLDREEKAVEQLESSLL
jgi:deoxycytidylate deaminase